MTLFTINAHQSILQSGHLRDGRRMGQFGGGVRLLDVAPTDASGVVILDLVVQWFHACQSTARTVQKQAHMRRWSNVKTTIFQIVNGGSIPTTAHHIDTTPRECHHGIRFCLPGATE